MTTQVHQFPCLDDNYGFLLRDSTTGQTAAIDAPDASAILAELERRDWTLTMILNTHWHRDHTGGNEELKRRTGATVIGPSEIARATSMDRVVAHGDVVELGATSLQVIATPGHTLGHICYYAPDECSVFVGDTLFALGCGRLFEGTPEQMWLSLMRLGALPNHTRVYCAHEYTLANARFALSVDDNPALQARAVEIARARERGEPTVPTTIGDELRTNPFLRALDAAHFASLRRAKDRFTQ